LENEHIHKPILISCAFFEGFLLIEERIARRIKNWGILVDIIFLKKKKQKKTNKQDFFGSCLKYFENCYGSGLSCTVR
jgi:hypothetical protein